MENWYDEQVNGEQPVEDPLTSIQPALSEGSTLRFRGNSKRSGMSFYYMNTLLQIRNQEIIVQLPNGNIKNYIIPPKESKLHEKLTDAEAALHLAIIKYHQFFEAEKNPGDKKDLRDAIKGYLEDAVELFLEEQAGQKLEEEIKKTKLI